MNEPKHASVTEKLIQAYDKMMERVSASLEEAEEKALPTLKENIDKAAEKAVELEELTHDEAQKIAMYLRRDLQDAGRHLADTGEQLGSWLKFDMEQIEDRLLEFMSHAADKTRLQLLELQHELEEDPPHHSGEITGPGTFTVLSAARRFISMKPATSPPAPSVTPVIFDGRRWRIEAFGGTTPGQQGFPDLMRNLDIPPRNGDRIITGR